MYRTISLISNTLLYIFISLSCLQYYYNNKYVPQKNMKTLDAYPISQNPPRQHEHRCIIISRDAFHIISRLNPNAYISADFFFICCVSSLYRIAHNDTLLLVLLTTQPFIASSYTHTHKSTSFVLFFECS